MKTKVPISTIEKRLRELGISQRDLPMSTVRRWSAEGLLPKPKTYYTSVTGGPGKRAFWPVETAEQAAAVWYLRHADMKWTTSTKRSLLAAKKVVEDFYSSVRTLNRALDRFANRRDAEGSKRLQLAYRAFNRLLAKVDVPPNRYFPDGARGAMYGGYELHPLVVNWIVALEKIRHDYPLSQPARVSFNWNRHAVSESEVRVRYDGVSVEPAADNTLIRHMGTTENAKRVLRTRLANQTDRDLSHNEFTPALQGKLTPERETKFRVAEQDNVSVDIERQQITIVDAKTRRKTVIDLSGSGVELISRAQATRKMSPPPKRNSGAKPEPKGREEPKKPSASTKQKRRASLRTLTNNARV